MRWVSDGRERWETLRRCVRMPVGPRIQKLNSLQFHALLTEGGAKHLALEWT